MPDQILNAIGLQAFIPRRATESSDLSTVWADHVTNSFKSIAMISLRPHSCIRDV